MQLDNVQRTMGAQWELTFLRMPGKAELNPALNFRCESRDVATLLGSRLGEKE